MLTTLSLAPENYAQGNHDFMVSQMEVGLPDLANKNTGYPIIFEFHIDI